MLELVVFFLASIGILWILEKLFEAYVLNKYLAELTDKQEVQAEEEDEDWILPLKLEYTDEMWYAWDKDNTFVMQARTRCDLILKILTKFDISPKRIKIEHEEKVDELQKPNLQN